METIYVCVVPRPFALGFSGNLCGCRVIFYQPGSGRNRFDRTIVCRRRECGTGIGINWNYDFKSFDFQFGCLHQRGYHGENESQHARGFNEENPSPANVILPGRKSSRSHLSSGKQQYRGQRYRYAGNPADRVCALSGDFSIFYGVLL